MKKTVSVVVALSLLCAFPASASIFDVNPVDYAARTPSPAGYIVDDVSFMIPDGFSILEESVENLVFSPDNGSTVLRVAKLDGAGMSLGDVGEKFKSVFFVSGLTFSEAAINGIPYVDCTFSDDSLGCHGMAALFLDESAESVYVFCYMSHTPITNNDRLAYAYVLKHISAPTILQSALTTPTPSPSPTPEPTPEPTPKHFPDLDFDAVNRSPDKYDSDVFTISGTVNQTLEGKTDDGSDYIMAFIYVNDDRDKEICATYFREPGEDRILTNDRVTFHGVLYGVESYEQLSGLTVPLLTFVVLDGLEIS